MCFKIGILAVNIVFIFFHHLLAKKKSDSYNIVPLCSYCYSMDSAIPLDLELFSLPDVHSYCSSNHS